MAQVKDDIHYTLKLKQGTVCLSATRPGVAGRYKGIFTSVPHIEPKEIFEHVTTVLNGPNIGPVTGEFTEDPHKRVIVVLIRAELFTGLHIIFCTLRHVDAKLADPLAKANKKIKKLEQAMDRMERYMFGVHMVQNIRASIMSGDGASSLANIYVNNIPEHFLYSLTCLNPTSLDVHVEKIPAKLLDAMKNWKMIREINVTAQNNTMENLDWLANFTGTTTIDIESENHASTSRATSLTNITALTGLPLLESFICYGAPLTSADIPGSIKNLFNLEYEPQRPRPGAHMVGYTYPSKFILRRIGQT